MDQLRKALDRFRTAHEDFLHTGSPYATGYGLDPDRKGKTGIVVFAMEDDEDRRLALVQKAKSNLPDSWEGYPVYVDGKPIPRALTVKR